MKTYCLYDASHKTCFDVVPSVPWKHRNNIFASKNIWSVIFDANCDTHRKTQLW